MTDTKQPGAAPTLFFWLVALAAGALLVLVSAAALSGTLGWPLWICACIGGALTLGLLEVSRRVAKLTGRRALVTGVLASLLLVGANVGAWVGFDLDSEAIIISAEDLLGKERKPADDIVPEGATVTANCEWRDSLPGGGLDEPVFPVVEGWESAMPEHVEPRDGEAQWAMSYRKGSRVVRVLAVTGTDFGADFFERKYAYQRAQVQGLDNHCVLLPKRATDDSVVWKSGKWLVTASSGSSRAGSPAVGEIAPALLRVFPSDLPRPPAKTE